MNEKELQFILQEGEGLKIEFKEIFDAKHTAKEVVALANSSGGRIFLGVTDKGEVKGVVITNKLKSEIQDMARNCEPSIKISLEVVKFKGKEILVVIVPEGENKPYLCSGGFFLRQGANSQKLSRDEILNFAVYEGKIKFDTQLNEKFIFEEHFDRNRFNDFLKRIGLNSSDVDINNLMNNLGLGEFKRDIFLMNNGGILFFAKYPNQFFSTSKVVCVNYQGNDKVKILDRKVFDEGIIGNIQETINYVKQHINTEFEIKTAQRKEILQYPEEAIREAIVNAIMHRDYFDNSGDILVEVFKNKLIFSNPGGLVRGLKAEEFGMTSRTRNSLIADLLLRSRYVEKLGTGVVRIRRAFEEAHFPAPEFKFNGSFFLTFYDKTKVTEKVTVKGTEKVTVNQTNIMEFIVKNKFITSKELSLLVGISERKVKENIAKLKLKGILERIGSDKSGYWVLKNEKD